MKDMIAAWAHLMHMDTAVEVAHLDHKIGWIEWELGKTYLLVDLPWEDHMIEVVPVPAFHRMVAFRTAAGSHSQVGWWAFGKLVENSHARMDAVSGHDYCTFVLHIHAHSPAEVLPENMELDAHNLNHVVVHNYNLLVEDGPYQGQEKDHEHAQNWG